MEVSMCMTTSSNSISLKPIHNPLLGHASSSSSTQFLALRRKGSSSFTTKALLSTSKELVLKEFHNCKALKIISGLQNFDKENVASVVTAADKGGATHVDIACDPELVKLAITLTSLPVCVSSVDPAAFLAAVEAGATMVEIGNYDSFYEKGVIFTPEQILNLTKETKRSLPSITLSVTVPHTLSLPDQVKLAEMLEQEGVDIIQTEGGKCSNPTKSGILGLIEKATPTLAAAYSISRAVKIPVMCSSGLSAVTAPMAITAGAAGVGVGSAINKLNDVVAMIAEVRSISNSLSSSGFRTANEEQTLKL
ncbi:hypothetical protein F8388_000021 [Cannabis sativa]|uniref:Uncharacterized protein ycf23 n=1 Tax=Cannabis sativa TaxID=3483 RepID=A0A7J6GSV6_CANSA|nr:hypothetical protein F8388_000021 [Cannabis sativa]KAF4386014.1 hypothetical protein G4B88_031149 [Cannabis sativa]